MRKVLIPLAAAFLFIGITALPAAAWEVHASGSAVCLDDGTFRVSWTYASSHPGEVALESVREPDIVAREHVRLHQQHGAGRVGQGDAGHRRR